MLEWFLSFVNSYLVPFVIDLVIAALLLLIGFKVVKILIQKLQKQKFFAKLDSNIATLILQVLHVLLNALLIIIAIQILGVPSATIIAVISSCGLAFGLALQGGLSNLAGGVMLMIFKPFHAGDYIATAEHEGTVNEIGIFYTKLITPDNRSINIPNSVLSSTTVINLSAQTYRGIDIPISVAYGTDIALARRTLLACAEENPLILSEPEPRVFIKAYESSGILLMFRAFAASECFFDARTRLYEDALAAVTAAGIEIPFPQIDVHMKKDAAE